MMSSDSTTNSRATFDLGVREANFSRCRGVWLLEYVFFGKIVHKLIMFDVILKSPNYELGKEFWQVNSA